MLMIKKNQRGNATPLKYPSSFAEMNNNTKNPHLKIQHYVFSDHQHANLTSEQQTGLK